MYVHVFNLSHIHNTGLNINAILVPLKPLLNLSNPKEAILNFDLISDHKHQLIIEML